MIIAIAATSVTFGQMKKVNDTNNSVETRIIALEKQAWEEWRNKNRAFVQNYLSDDAFFVYGDGVVDKPQIVKAIGSCEFNSYSLDNFKFLNLDKNTALLTYTAKQDIVCDGKTQPAMIRSTSVYVKRGGKWLAAFYTETPAVQ
ncbi:MAG TPA: nuclear transport factor 2 family protein [Pyrinomonadaceae bacterium]|nr:nuclear transport factor 2 family protein [Pyrinomonadaceae bacterium]